MQTLHKTYITIVANIVSVPLILFSWIVPKKKCLVLLTSTTGERFADSPKYFYLYLVQQPGIEVYWAVNNAALETTLRTYDLPVSPIWSLRHFWRTLRAQYVINDNTPNAVFYDSVLWFLGRFHTIQTWHGTPMKRIGLQDDKYTRNADKLSTTLAYWIQRGRYHSYELILTTCPEAQEMEQIYFENNNIKILGYPRNDILVGPVHNPIPSPVNDLQLDRFRRVAVYAPTYRDVLVSGTPFTPEALFALNTALSNTNTILVLKKHPADTQLQINDSFSHIIDATGALDDLQELLTVADVVITDYSSVFFDFALTDRPMIFFPYDYEEYISKSRSLDYDYYDTLPGPFAHTMDELITHLATIDAWSNTPEYRQAYSAFKDRFNTHQDGKSSERLFQRLFPEQHQSTEGAEK